MSVESFVYYRTQVETRNLWFEVSFENLLVVDEISGYRVDPLEIRNCLVQSFLGNLVDLVQLGYRLKRFKAITGQGFHLQVLGHPTFIQVFGSLLCFLQLLADARLISDVPEDHQLAPVLFEVNLKTAQLEERRCNLRFLDVSLRTYFDAEALIVVSDAH